tara:strand:+ start:292 stop:831 length:540 start_codon:yes stop_codon:yes gene_type:complete
LITIQTSEKLSKPIELSQEEKINWMTRLLTKAILVGKRGEVPIAAIILDNRGRCIGYGENRRETTKDPLGHAELVALRQASWLNNDWRFNDCTLMVNLEPCPMCAGALIQARMGKIIYGSDDLKRGALGGSINLAEHKSAHHKMLIERGIMEKESRKIIVDWFKEKRLLARENLSSKLR